MTDFRKLAAEAKAASDQAKADKDADAKAKRAASEAAVAKATAALDRMVVPMLQKAITDFEAEGVAAQFTKSYDVVGHYTLVRGSPGHAEQARPSISFQCVHPPHTVGGKPIPSPGVLFESDGDRILAGASEYGFDRTVKEPIGQAPVAQSEKLIVTAIQAALTAHFAKR